MVAQVVNQSAMQALLKGKNGPVARQALRRGIKVQTAARRNLGGGTGSGPKRVDTGLLRASISVQLRTWANGDIAVRIGTNVYYAYWVHEGTGVFGPKHHRIYPKRARYLRFKPKGMAKYIYRQSVAGMKPNPFLVKALPAAKLNNTTDL